MKTLISRIVFAALFVLFAAHPIAQALGDSPLRLEVSYMVPDRLALSGLVDINRVLAVRLRLLEVKWPGLNFGIGLPDFAGVPGLSEAVLVYSPWRDKLTIKPYGFGGLGYELTTWKNESTSTTHQVAYVNGRLGAGVEPLLFFLPRIPPAFFELGVTFGGIQTTATRPPDNPPLPFPILRYQAKLAFGVRI